MCDVRIFTLAFDPATGLFDESPLRGWLAQRELIRAEPQSFVHDGRPSWTVYVEARPLVGSSAADACMPPS